MAGVIQRLLQDFFLSVLGLIGGVCVLYWISVMAHRFFVRVRAVGIGLALLLSLVAVIVTGEAQKRNGAMGTSRHTIVRASDSGAQVGRDVPNAPPAQSPRTSAAMPFRAAKWNVRGAWDDSFRYAFADGWEFPFGTGHLDRVEVCSQGRVIPCYGSADVIADMGVPLQIVNPITSFGCGATDRNSYVFSWTNAVVGRALRGGAMGTSHPTMDASIELFRNGDVGITTNGVTELIPRVLPFPHDGFGQDAEWVAANFTNAAEVLSVGYPQWVDAQVGENLTNGLYKFTVTVPDVPPETIRLVVGGYSVAVTNAGDYVFLLEKGIRHQIHLSPFRDGVEYSCNDDMLEDAPPLRGGMPPKRETTGSSPYIVSITATADSENGVELVAPTLDCHGHVLFWPWLSIAPSEVTTAELPVAFVADVFDIPLGAKPSFVWKRGEEVVGTGEVFVLTGMGDGDLGAVDVFATYRDVTLHGVVMIARHVGASSISLGGGGLVFVEDSYTNAPGDVVSASSTTTGVHLAWSLAEAGQLKLEADCAEGVAVYEDYGDGIELPVPLAWTRDADCDEVGSRDFLVYCTDMSNAGTIGTFTFSFTPDDGGASLTNAVSLQFVKIKVEAEADWPSNKVRHVFGPRERFRITSSPQVLLEVDPTSHASVTNTTTVIAPDRAGPFPVAASIGTVTNNLLFDCIAPTEVKGENPRGVSADEWRVLKLPILTTNDACAAMHIDTWLEPLYVSFRHLRIYEGYAPPINRMGWYQNTETFALADLEHGEEAGASSGGIDGSNGISETGNYIGNGDFVVAFIEGGHPYYNGSYQLSIPVYWFAVGGAVTNRLSNSVQTIQIYSNGTMRVSKNGVTWEQPLGGQGHPITE